MGLQRLQHKLGYQFNNERLLERALTHRSHGQSNNERLEFLGDSILNFSVAALLFEWLREEDEGDLSRIRASLVNQQTLAEMAQQLELSQVLRLGEGELKSGGFKRPSILADALEAVFGAIYIDANIEIAQAVIGRLYRPLIQTVDLKTAGKDSKTLLQETLQAKRLSLPKYEVIETRGAAHSQEFLVECVIQELDVVTQATGSSRRQAEQNAAAVALSKVQTLLTDKSFDVATHQSQRVTQLSLPVATPQAQGRESSHDT